MVSSDIVERMTTSTNDGLIYVRGDDCGHVVPKMEEEKSSCPIRQGALFVHHISAMGHNLTFEFLNKTHEFGEYLFMSYPT